MDINTKKPYYKCTKFWYTWKANTGAISWLAGTINLIGDKSLSEEILEEYRPLSKFGAKFRLRNDSFLPLKMHGSSNLKPINTMRLRFCSV